MGRPKTIQETKKLCAQCRQNRYNMGRGFVERPGIDAVVMCDHCWLLDPAKALYCRGEKKWVMPCNDNPYQRGLAAWAKTGARPTWKPY